MRGNKVFIQGEGKTVKAVKVHIQDIISARNEGLVLNTEDLRYAIDNVKKTNETGIKDFLNRSITVAIKHKQVAPRTEMQRLYIDAIKKYDIVVGIGPAGTGKTYIAMAMAVNALINKQVKKIILARPAVEAGEKLGFLPGDIYEKVNPYLRPLYDALYDMMDVERAAALVEKGIIEIAPLAFMRGRTLNDAFVILDEAQNTTTEQMKMYLTRLGFNSKTVINGDVTQVDLPQGQVSGLIEIEHVLDSIEGIKFVYFTDEDVVRHKLVQEIIKAYEKFKRREKEKTS
ncbi:MAG: PhoH family protein [Candidatus Magnetoovum sp. WYHC-5]|nr:PhoH family protein [Candidatus Magnetoovum sp. WYHC-5]